MELRSSRSRSRTPFVQLTRLEEENMANSMKQKTIEERRTYTTRQKTIELSSSSLVDDVFETSASYGNVKQTRSEEKSRGRHKTSDYSSEEENGENGAVKSALQVYQEAGEYWNKYPKTDYTYSLHSKDRKEVAPGVICMPNMSRKSLRGSAEPTPRYNAVRTQYSANNVARKTLNFEANDGYTATKKNVSVYQRIRTSVRSVITRFYRTVTTLLFAVYTVAETSMLWTASSYYKTVSRLFLFDTWLMQKTSAPTAAQSKKYGALVAIMLLPLLLFAGIHFAQTYG